MNGKQQRLRAFHRRIGPPRPAQRKPTPADTATGKVNIVDHAQPVKQQGNLIGTAQAATDSLLTGQIRHVLTKQTHTARGWRKIPCDRIEQSGLPRPV